MNKFLAVLFFALSASALSGDTLVKFYVIDRATLGDSAFVGGVDKPFASFGVHGQSAIADTFYEVNYSGKYGYLKFLQTDVAEIQAMDDLIAEGYARTLQTVKVFTRPDGTTAEADTPFQDLPDDYFDPNISAR